MAIIATLTYGIICLRGGLVGYFKAGSEVSLLSGSISGILLLVCSYLQGQGYGWALTIARDITIILVIVFLIRLTITGNFMPAGVMAILGIVALALMIKR